MAAVANNPKFARKVGIPQSVGEDYVEADKGRKFRSGGMAGCGTKRMSKGGMSMAAGKGYRRGGKTEIEPKMTTYKSREKTAIPMADPMITEKMLNPRPARTYYKKGGCVGDGCAIRGRTKGRMV